MERLLRGATGGEIQFNSSAQQSRRAATEKSAAAAAKSNRKSSRDFRAANPRRRTGRNGGRHRAKIRSEIKRVAGRESRRQSRETSRRANPEHSVAVIPRIAFFLIAAFWVTMNVALWRAEYGSHGGEIFVPAGVGGGKKLFPAPNFFLRPFYGGGRGGFF